MSAMLLITVQRRPGAGHVIQKFMALQAAGTDGCKLTVEQSFEKSVVPMLVSKGMLRGRDWGRLLSAEVQLRNDAGAGLIEVGEVRLSLPTSTCAPLHLTLTARAHAVKPARARDDRALPRVMRAAQRRYSAVHRDAAEQTGLYRIASRAGAATCCVDRDRSRSTIKFGHASRLAARRQACSDCAF